ncbi:DUF4062 domain-containing protein [Halomonas sp. GT]|uniref:DUF4062 domain-containing protein n=1 Tax=Halomonas sp. GT TaxID=1971364 RepID=UPI0009F4970A|nr:DUF4062 domain-containing protein [Halomonas sp. GT]
MARPRVFISSTYFDLKNVRSDLERFIKEIGYDPVLNERGNIPYGNQSELEQYCYKEINNCDILISIVGSRYGTGSRLHDASISNQELKQAIDLGKQVYIFIDKTVHAEFRTYEKNKKNENIQYAAVDNPKIYKFIEEISSLPINNNIAGFETSSDIIFYLREQWSGLFQRLLSEEAKKKELQAIEDIKSAAKTLEQLVTFLTNERKETDSTIKEILLSNHPAFLAIKQKLLIPFRVYFTNLDELNELLSDRGFEDINIPGIGETDSLEWCDFGSSKLSTVKISSNLFDDQMKLNIITPEEWDDSWVQVHTQTPRRLRDVSVPPATSDFDDEIPF